VAQDNPEHNALSYNNYSTSHMLYFSLHCLFGLLLLAKPSLRPTFLRGARTLLSLPISSFVAFGPVSLGNKSHIWSTEHFQVFFHHFKVALDLNKSLYVV